MDVRVSTQVHTLEDVGVTPTKPFEVWSFFRLHCTGTDKIQVSNWAKIPHPMLTESALHPTILAMNAWLPAPTDIRKRNGVSFSFYATVGVFSSYYIKMLSSIRVFIRCYVTTLDSPLNSPSRVSHRDRQHLLESARYHPRHENEQAMLLISHNALLQCEMLFTRGGPPTN